MILRDWQPVSTSGNVALFPAVACSGNGSCACAWYEYSASDRPARSDIWFARGSEKPGAWGAAEMISGGVSYNNGPSLAVSDHGDFLVAWHSWRPPGREPFTADGDVCNIWVSRSQNQQWSQPVMAFPHLTQTEYASLAFADGSFHLACYHRDSSRIRLAQSADGEHWSEIDAFPHQFGSARFPSLAAMPDGTLALAFMMPGKPGIWLSKRTRAGAWAEPKSVCEVSGAKLGKPKLSVDSKGAMWISAQTDHWGSYEKHFSLEVPEAQPVEIELRPTGGAGNAMWTLNEMDFCDRNGQSKKCLRFGPEPNKVEARVEHISARTWACGADRGSGFDAPVEELLRELGNEVTRRLVFSSEARRLKVDLGPGSYELKVTHSSWIASRPGLDLRANVVCEPRPAASPASDRCYFFRETNPGQFVLAASTPEEQEHNRPGAVCETSPGRFQLAWTSFAGEAVEVVTQNIPIP